MKVSVFIAASVDGYIAREDGGIDWLENPDANPNQDYGYQDFIRNIDAILMGRNTFDVVMNLPDWSYGGIPLFVLTHHPSTLPSDKFEEVQPIQGKPQEIINELEKLGFHNIYIDGGKTISDFLSESLVDEMIITRIPILLGRGISLFNPMEKEARLELLSTIDFEDGLVQNKYKVLK
ncbi:MAG: dihydrofolate reductase [Chloroflexi bacterium]|nr:dihydrofolate reductase [Chloroflexota bacterium]